MMWGMWILIRGSSVDFLGGVIIRGFIFGNCISCTDI